MLQVALGLLLSDVSAPKITGASLFKNGYAMVSREIPVTGSGTVTFTDLPNGTLGTFWISTSGGVKVDRVVATNREENVTVEAGSVLEILTLNKGKNVVLGIKDGDKQIGDQVAGTLLSASEIVVVRTADRGILTFPRGYVTSIASPSGELLYSRSEKRSTRVLDLHIPTNVPGTIYMVDLEPGMSWVPSYAVDITDPKTLSITAKSTVVNNTATLNDVEVKFVTGFPNILWLGFEEPLLSTADQQQFASYLGNIASNSISQRRDMAPKKKMGGARGSAFGDGEGVVPTGLGGFEAEDLFFYRQPHVTLKPGDRSYYILFEAKSAYEHLYTLDLEDLVMNNVEYEPLGDDPLDVWHSLKFTNTSGQPLTTGPATVFKGGETMGQDLVKYTSKGEDALVRMSKALDVRAEQTEEEVTRERGAIKNTYNQNVFDLVTLKGTIEIHNGKAEEIKMKIAKDLTGEMVSADHEPKVIKTAKGLKDVNPRQHLDWTPTIAPNKTLLISYSYKLYVKSQ